LSSNILIFFKKSRSDFCHCGPGVPAQSQIAWGGLRRNDKVCNANFVKKITNKKNRRMADFLNFLKSNKLEIK